MNYSNLTQEVKTFFINKYSKDANALRVKASNPKARKTSQYLEQASRLDSIINELKAA